MSLWRIVWRSLGHYWRTNAFVVLGVLVATAVMTGSLLVGGSMRESLRRNVVGRLGSVDDVLVAPHFFSETLGARVAGALGGRVTCATVLQVRGVAGGGDEGARGRVGESANRRGGESAGSEVVVMGVDEGYWGMFGGAAMKLGAGEAAVSRSLAEDLHLKVGGDIVVSAERSGTVADDVLFADRKREDTLRVMRLEVKAIVEDGQGGDFGMSAGSLGATAPRNVFVPREYLGRVLERAGAANEILLHAGGASLQEVHEALAREMGLADYGLTLVKSEAGGDVMMESSGLLLTGDQIVAAQQAAKDVGGKAYEASTYLATRVTLQKQEAGSKKQEGVGEIAYAIVSTIPQGAALKMTAGAAPGFLGDGVIVNEWAAEDLGAKVGDELEMTYLVPTAAGEYVEEKMPLKVAGVVALEGAAADRHLTPSLNGLTDAKRIDEWRLPFPVEKKRLTARDEAYWDKYGPTPKIFVPAGAMEGIWRKALASGPGGWVTAMRLVPGGTEADAATRRRGDAAGGAGGAEAASGRMGETARGDGEADLGQFEGKIGEALLRHLSPERNWMVFREVRGQMLAAAAGSTDFGQLFFAMSFFLIVAAAALAGMLMRLLVEQRAGEIGALFACGWRRRKVTGLLLGEGLVLTVVGVAAGAPAGVLYDRAIIGALNRWWMGPWGHPVLEAYVSGAGLMWGAVSGLVVGMLCALWGVRAMSKATVLQLLSGRQGMEVGMQMGRRRRGWAAWAGVVGLVVAAGAMLAAAGMGMIAAAEGFFGGGAALLTAGLLGLWAAFGSGRARRGAVGSLMGLAVRNVGVNRRRSMLTVGLLAAACFMLVAVAAMGRNFSQLDTTDRRSGAGGFVLRATTAVPVHFDFGTAAGRGRLGVSAEEEKVLAGVEIFGLAESGGDDVSCLNLAKPLRPRLLGVTVAFAKRGGFAVEVAKGAGLADGGNPWELLMQGGEKDGAIPVFGDADSVQWILHSGLGEIYEFPGADGKVVKLRIVGVMPGSIFAGELLVGEENLRRIFPGVNGANYFLAGPREGGGGKWDEGAVADALRGGLADEGAEVRATREILNRYISVQNVYLSIFLSLGGLGLMLGTGGMVAVIARSVLERRGELALMAAAGFRRGVLVRLVAAEHVGLLACGVVMGSVCALVAVMPVLRSGAGGASQVEWGRLGLVLGLVGVIGLGACIVAAWWAVGRRPAEGLREE